MNNEPAFPMHGTATTKAQEGMTLLDYFAGQALINLMPPLHGWANASIAAYNMAEAMMAERKRRSNI